MNGAAAAEPATCQPVPDAAGQLGGQSQAQLVDQLSRGQAGVKRRPALAQDMAQAPVPQCLQRGAEIDGAGAGGEHVGHRRGIRQCLGPGAFGRNHDGPRALPGKEPRPPVQCPRLGHHGDSR